MDDCKLLVPLLDRTRSSSALRLSTYNANPLRRRGLRFRGTYQSEFIKPLHGAAIHTAKTGLPSFISALPIPKSLIELSQELQREAGHSSR